MSDRSEKPLVLPGPAPGVSERGQGPERRAYGRVPFTAAAQVYEVRLGTRVNGRCSDIGAGGCYIDTLTPLSVGAPVKVRIELKSRIFEAAAVVSYAHTAMGMGLSFTEVKPEHRELLHFWIAALGDGQVSGDTFRPQLFSPDPETEGSDEQKAWAVLQELIGLLVRKKLLTDQEAEAFLCREPR